MREQYFEQEHPCGTNERMMVTDAQIYPTPSHLRGVLMIYWIIKFMG